MARTENMMLREVLQYLRHDGMEKEGASNIQICFKKDEWDAFEEVNAASEMLVPFEDCEVICMGAEKSVLIEGESVIRVSIDEDSRAEEEYK